VIRRTARRHTTSMISTVTNRGSLRFMLYEGALNAALFLTFLQRLVRSARRKLFLIVDNLKVHKAGKVQAWVAAHRERIELFFLPAYAPVGFTRFCGHCYAAEAADWNAAAFCSGVR